MSVAKKDLIRWCNNGFTKDGCFVYRKNMSKGEFEVLIRDLYSEHCNPWYSMPKFDITIFNFDGYQGWSNSENDNTCYDIFCYVKNSKSRWDRHKLLKDYGFCIYNDMTKK